MTNAGNGRRSTDELGHAVERPLLFAARCAVVKCRGTQWNGVHAPLIIGK